MSNNQYKIALTHALLAGTSLLCIHRYSLIAGSGWKWAYGSFGIIFINSLLGIWKYGNPDYGNAVNSIYNIFSMSASVLSLPGIITDIYLKNGFTLDVALSHCVVPLVPLIPSIVGGSNGMDENLVDMINFGELVSISYLSYISKNYYGIAMILAYAYNHFYLKENMIRDVPKKITYNLGMCFFCFFGLRALGDN